MSDDKPDEVESEESGNNDTQTAGTEFGNAGGTDAQPDYAMIMETMKQLQANQAAMSAQLKAISDAQSVIVDAGAVVREMPASQIDTGNDPDNDGFISLDDMDLSI